MFVFSSLAFAASGIQLVSLEPSYDETQNIELNTSTPGYDFDVTFFEDNQTITYTATIKKHRAARHSDRNH